MSLTNLNESVILDRYLYYYLKLIQPDLYEMTKHAIPPCLQKSELVEIKIPIVDLKIQKQIVNALDQLSTLCNDLSTGLPAQIANANKQYQYYLKQLLTF